MRKPPLYFAAWVAAGIGAVALTSAAVSQVGDQVTGSRPAPLSADDVRAELDAEVTTTSSAGPSTATTDLVEPTPTTTGGPPATTAPRPGPTTTALASETRTYTLIGGTATLRFEPSGVSVVTATPNAGFSVEVEPDDSHAGGIEVEFRSANHKSKVEGWWDNGPRDEVREED